MMSRLKKRGESSGRADDNEETIKTRINTYHAISKPVVSQYSSKIKRVSTVSKLELILTTQLVNLSLAITLVKLKV